MWKQHLINYSSLLYVLLIINIIYLFFIYLFILFYFYFFLFLKNECVEGEYINPISNSAFLVLSLFSDHRRFLLHLEKKGHAEK